MKNIFKIIFIISFIACVNIVVGSTKVQGLQSNLSAKMWVESPKYNSNISGTSAQVKGWSLNSSGVKRVEIYIDGKQVGNANIGQARPDVNSKYPGYQGGSSSGFTYNLNISNLTEGQHVLAVKSIGNDGNIVKQYIMINVNKLTAKMWVESPKYNANISGTSAQVKGWSLNSSGVKRVEIYIDGKQVGNANIGQARPDVNSKYPGYQGGSNSGFTYNFDTSNLTESQHVLAVKSVGNDGNIVKQYIIINVNNKIIAIDIGHNVPPYDVGAEAILKEGQVNLEVGQKVISKLRSKGYNVISTKPASATSESDSLQQRVDTANNANADLFISIHGNVGGGAGTEVWAGGSAKSIELGQNIEDNMVELGYRNRGVKVQGANGYDHLYVLNNTKMPAVLVETFFLDSQEDVNRYNSEDIANAIVDGIISSLD